jgi:hypothetical protein
MIEAVVEDHLSRRVRALGGETRKMQWIGRKGAPDRACCCRGAASRWSS